MDVRANEFAAAEAKARFSELLDRAEKGEEIVIKRHGRTVAKLVPVVPMHSVEDRRRMREEWIEYRKKHGPRLGPDLTIKQLIEEGRKY
jgi:prevent-host-death family protein